MKKLIAVVLVFLIGAASAFAKNGFEYYNEGYDKYLEKDYKAAVKLFKKAIKKKPDFVKSYNKAGLSYIALHKVDHAMYMYKKSIHVDPEYAEAYYNMGVACEIKYPDNPKKAEKNYLKVIELDNDKHSFVRSSLNLARIYRKQGKVDDAIALIRKAMVYEPEFAELYNEAGLIYIDSFDLVQDNAALNYAIKFFLQALEYDQQYVEAATNLGLAYQMKGQLARAIAQYEKAMQIDTEVYGEKYHYPRKYGITGKYPIFHGLHYNYGNALLVNKFYEKAEAHLKKATLIKKDFKEAYYSLGKAQMHLNKFKEAEESLKEALKIDKDFRKAKDTLMEVRRLREEFRDHIEFAKKKTGDEDEEAEEETDEEEDAADDEGAVKKKEEKVENVEDLRLEDLYPKKTGEDEEEEE